MDDFQTRLSTLPTIPDDGTGVPCVLPSRSASRRLDDFDEVYEPANINAAQREGRRCMKCGAAFCMPNSGYGQGCPILNKIPEMNELVNLGRWREAYDRLSITNPFPEFTSRICPAPCRDACIVGINEEPIQIKGIERAIIDRAFAEGWVLPPMPSGSIGKRIAIIGSGPAGLAAADRLVRLGYEVTVFERADEPGGLLMYGVPNMKLGKDVVRRRVELLRQAGVKFEVGVAIGTDIDPKQLLAEFDATLLAIGAPLARDLDVPGRESEGVYQAMDYLTESTKTLNRRDEAKSPIDADGLDVIVVGGGDTGADCIGTALRQRCRSVVNITRREQPPDQRDAKHPWPGPTGTYSLDYSHTEGLDQQGRDPREYEIQPLEILADPSTKRVLGMRVRHLGTGMEEELPAQLILLAIGFTGHDTPSLVASLRLQENRGCIVPQDRKMIDPQRNLFVAGDCRRGPSLVVWAIGEGTAAAAQIHARLTTGHPSVD